MGQTGSDPRARSEQAPGTILVVDDNPSARAYVADVLQLVGFAVTQASTGAEGLRLAKDAPDLIVLDVSLPDVDGAEVRRRIKEDPLTASIPVLHLSGVHREGLDKARALEDGASGYLVKPVAPEELIATVRTLLRASRAELESEARFRLLMDSAPILVTGFDADGRVVLFNRACEELTGCRRDDALGQPLAQDLLPEAWRGRVASGDLPCPTAPVEHSWTTAAGVERQIESRAFTVPAGDGNRILVQVGHDITERKRAADLSAQRAAQARFMVDVGRAITSSLDLPAVLDLIVDRVCVLLRAPRSGLAILEPGSNDPDIRFVASRGMAPGFHELRPRHWRDGTTATAIHERRPVWSADVLHDPAFELSPSKRAVVESTGYRAVLSAPLLAGEQALGALSVYRDTPGEFSDDDVELLQVFAAQAAVAIRNAQFFAESERRQHEAEILAALVRDINASLDLDTVLQGVVASAKDLCVADFARIALRMPESRAAVFRYAPGARFPSWTRIQVEPGQGAGGQVLLTGQPVRTANDVEESCITDADLAPSRAEGVVAEMVVPIRVQDAIEGLLYVSNRSPRPFTDRDQTVLLRLANYAGTAIKNARLYDELREAHERLRRSQDQLVQAERLRALGEMAAGVAHDFNNMLAVILGRTELLQRRPQDAELERGLEAIRKAAQTGADTVRRIQEFTRTRRTRPFERVDLRTIIAEVIELTRPRWKDEAQRSGVRYEVTLEGAAPPVQGRPEDLREMFTNLLVNALEAMPAGGTCAFQVRAARDTVVVTVDDTGCGMSEETRRRIFEPFFSTKGPRGNGLGLAVTWGIVQRHQGTIEVTSRVERGTTFAITLPASPMASPIEECRPATADAPSARVLVVDDEPELRDVLAAFLEDGGHTVVRAADGAEALRRLEQESFDVVLTDLSMPGMSGWQVAETCRERDLRCLVGVVTGWGDQLDPERVRREGIAFVIAKPFEAAEVLRCVDQAMRSFVAGTPA